MKSRQPPQATSSDQTLYPLHTFILSEDLGLWGFSVLDQRPTWTNMIGVQA